MSEMAVNETNKVSKRAVVLYYKVVEEKCGKGIKSHYSIGQRVSSAEIERLKNEFSYCMRDTFESRTHLTLDFYKLGLFRKRTDVYYVNFLKQ